MKRWHLIRTVALGVAAALCAPSVQAQGVADTLGQAVTEPTKPAPSLPATAVPAPVSGLEKPSSIQGLLHSYERLVPFLGGCSGIVRVGEPLYLTKQLRWVGGCRAGLADGHGYVIFEGQGSNSNYDSMSMRLGRVSAPAFRIAGGTKIVDLPAGAGRDESEVITTTDAFVRNPADTSADITARAGQSAFFILGTRSRRNETREIKDTLWIAKQECATVSPRMMIDLLARLTLPPLEPAVRAKVLAACNDAMIRLTREGRKPDTLMLFTDSPYKTLDYGYYIVAYLSHEILPLSSEGYAPYDPKTYARPTYTDVTACPQITTLAGCEAVWQPMLAPFVARRDTVIASSQKDQADDEADRQRRFAPLIAAERARTRNAALRLAAAYRPRIAPPLPTDARAAPSGAALAKPDVAKGKRK